jgi:hypothetical protein
MVVLDEQQLNEYNHYVLQIDVTVQVYYNYKHVQAYHPNEINKKKEYDII